MRHQVEVDRGLLAEIESGAYTFEDPLVVVDPYDQSPLAALVLFRTREATSLSIHIAGQDALTDIDFQFAGFETDHIVPVYGLHAGRVNAVTLTMTDWTGETVQATLSIEIGPLPEELGAVRILTDLKREYSGVN